MLRDQKAADEERRSSGSKIAPSLPPPVKVWIHRVQHPGGHQSGRTRALSSLTISEPPRIPRNIAELPAVRGELSRFAERDGDAGLTCVDVAERRRDAIVRPVDGEVAWTPRTSVRAAPSLGIGLREWSDREGFGRESSSGVFLISRRQGPRADVRSGVAVRRGTGPERPQPSKFIVPHATDLRVLCARCERDFPFKRCCGHKKRQTTAFNPLASGVNLEIAGAIQNTGGGT